MRSPFPGMDPYLEQHWRDVHHSLVTYCRDQLQAQLPGRLRARIDERVFVESESSDKRSIFSHVRVKGFPSRPSTTAETAEPDMAFPKAMFIHLDDDPVTEGFIEIIDTASGNWVITAIEFLSPTNKSAGDGTIQYQKKQEEYFAGQISVVEIDLTRGGDRRLLLPQNRIPPSHRTAYQVIVRRGWRRDVLEAYPVPLPQRLPVIPIPLCEGLADVAIDLQWLVDQCYANGCYAEDIDYRREPEPPLSPEDAAWADELLKAAGKR